MDFKDLQNANNYNEWLDIAYKIDKEAGKIQWREDEESELFHSKLMREHISRFKDLINQKKAKELIYLVQESLSRHFSELNNLELYSYALSGTKFIISEYFQLIEESINFITDNKIEGISRNEKIRILSEGNRVHGNTALLLSGGASFGIYHLGVVKALLELDLIPGVVAGSSMGGIVAAALCTKTDEELKEYFSNYSPIHKVAIKMFEPGEILEKGSVMDPSQLMEHIKANVGDYTFKEAYEKTGRVLNITVSATRKRQNPRVLNHINTPNLLIENSVLASCAIPGIFPPVKLLARNSNGDVLPYMGSEEWIDGSVHLDIPMNRIVRLHNVSRSIVSQANPHVLPFIFEKGQGILPFFQDLLASTFQTQIIKFMELGVHVSEKMPWMSIIDKARSMIDQEYVGDINIYYPMDLESLTRIVSNPSEEEFSDFLKKGELATWSKVEYIKDQMRLNKLLETCISRLNKRKSLLSKVIKNK